MPAGDQVPYMLGFSDRGLHGDTPFVIRAQKSLRKLGLTFTRCAATPLMSPNPPQVDLASNILLNLQDNFLIIIPHQLIQNCFSEFLSEHYPKHIQIYTDGSKSDGGSVSAGLFIPSTQLATGWLLRREHIVLGAELFAIHKAMELATEDVSMREEPVLILSDSRSALQLLSYSSGHSYRTIVFKIHELMLVKGLDKVVICWNGGHNARNRKGDLP
jgi:hypothetical protein